MPPGPGGEPAYQRRTARADSVILCGLQGLYRFFPAFRDNGLPGVYVGEEAAAIIEPHVGWGEVQAV